MRANHVRRRSRPGSPRSAPGSPSPARRRPSTSPRSGSTGSSSTPSTTRSTSAPWPRCSARSRQRDRADGAHPLEHRRRTSSGCSMPAPGASSCRWSTRGKRRSWRSSPPATTPRGRAASAAAASPCLRRPGPRTISATPTTKSWSCCRSSTSTASRTPTPSSACRASMPASSAPTTSPPRWAWRRRAAGERRAQLVEAIDHIRAPVCARRGAGHPYLRRGGRQPAYRGGVPVLAMASEVRYMLSGLRADIAELNWTRADAAEIGARASVGRRYGIRACPQFHSRFFSRRWRCSMMRERGHGNCHTNGGGAPCLSPRAQSLGASKRA